MLWLYHNCLQRTVYKTFAVERLVGEAFLKFFLEFCSVKTLANEDQLVNALLTFLPLGLGRAESDLLMHTLENELITFTVECHHSLGPVDVLCVQLQKCTHEGVELERV